jgi:hypothetical protein
MKTPSSSDLTRMRTMAEATLTQTCTIERPALAADGEGGQTVTYSTVGSGVACRVAREKTAGLAARRAGLTGIDMYLLKLASTQDVAAGDRVTVDSLAYSVEVVQDAHAWATLTVCEITRIT